MSAPSANRTSGTNAATKKTPPAKPRKPNPPFLRLSPPDILIEPTTPKGYGAPRPPSAGRRRPGGAGGEEDRPVAGHARHAGPAGAAAWPGARLHHCQGDRASLGRVPAGRAGLALSGGEPPGRSRLGRFLLGHVRKQPARPLLPPDAQGPAAAPGRDAAVGAARTR